MNLELYREALGFAIDKGLTQAQAEEYAREVLKIEKENPSL